MFFYIWLKIAGVVLPPWGATPIWINCNGWILMKSVCGRGAVCARDVGCWMLFVAEVGGSRAPLVKIRDSCFENKRYPPPLDLQRAPHPRPRPRPRPHPRPLLFHAISCLSPSPSSSSSHTAPLTFTIRFSISFIQFALDLWKRASSSLSSIKDPGNRLPFILSGGEFCLFTRAFSTEFK